MQIPLLVAGFVVIVIFSIPLNLEGVVMPFLMAKFAWQQWKVFLFCAFWGTCELKYYLWYIKRLEGFIIYAHKEEALMLWYRRGLKDQMVYFLRWLKAVFSEKRYHNHWALRTYQWAAKYHLGEVIIIIVAIFPPLWAAIAIAKIVKHRNGFWLIATGNLFKLFAFAFGIWPLILPYTSLAFMTIVLLFLVKIFIELKRRS